jgi:hypothetical protein
MKNIFLFLFILLAIFSLNCCYAHIAATTAETGAAEREQTRICKQAGSDDFSCSNSIIDLTDDDITDYQRKKLLATSTPCDRACFTTDYFCTESLKRCVALRSIRYLPVSLLAFIRAFRI